MSHVIWLFSDAGNTDGQAAALLEEHGMKGAFAWATNAFTHPGRETLPWAEAQEIAAHGHEVHSHGMRHDSWSRYTETEIARACRATRQWWANRLGRDCSACKIIGPPYYSTATIRRIALETGYTYTLSNWLTPADSVELPPGYEYQWITCYHGEGPSATLAALDWASKSAYRAVICSLHRLRDEPAYDKEVRWSDFRAVIDYAAELGLTATGVLGLA